MENEKENIDLDPLYEELDLLDARIQTLESKREPGSISKIIANKINRWNADDIFGIFLGFFVVASTTGMWVLIWNIAVAVDVPYRCEFYSKDNRWYFTTIVDWRPKTIFGPFESLEVTKEAAQLSGCPVEVKNEKD